MQVATPDECVAIDPLAVKDIAPLAELFDDPAVTKVFHACTQDMEVLLQALGTVPAPIFDTQVAAAFLSERQQISYNGSCMRSAASRCPRASRLPIGRAPTHG